MPLWQNKFQKEAPLFQVSVAFSLGENPSKGVENAVQNVLTICKFAQFGSKLLKFNWGYWVKWFFAFFSFFWLVWALGCLGDAPRDNPLDPANSPNTATLSGQVLTLYPPREPLAGVTLALFPEGRLTRSDNNGQFQFQDLKTGSYTLTASLNGFAADTQLVSLQSNQFVSLFLDALPVVDSVSLTTHHAARSFPPSDLYQYNLMAYVSDSDGLQDIALVWYEVSGHQFLDTLVLKSAMGSRQGLFSIQRTASQLPGGSLHQLAGQPFQIHITDVAGNTVTTDPVFISRIIETIPTIDSPAGLSTVTQFPVDLLWQPVILPFSFHWRIELHRVNLGLPTLLNTYEPIPADSTRFTLTTPLSSGDYLWVLFIVDNLGNTSRSREGVFRVP